MPNARSQTCMKGNNILRELKTNEMEMVSGGDAPAGPSLDPIQDGWNTHYNDLLTMFGIETWGDESGSGIPGDDSSGGLLMGDHSAQGFDATFTGGRHPLYRAVPDGFDSHAEYQAHLNDLAYGREAASGEAGAVLGGLMQDWINSMYY